MLFDGNALRRVSIHAPLARSNFAKTASEIFPEVSIHAPLARSNSVVTCKCWSLVSFNTCSSCEEQPVQSRVREAVETFQYMLLLRGATHPAPASETPHAVSIHAPLARSNPAPPSGTRPLREFQYMLLLRGATIYSCQIYNTIRVSIHAPLARSNLSAVVITRLAAFQYMLLLRGATRLMLNSGQTREFQYMLLLRGATCR